jgi:glutamyl/glutaminyl-tRNA synthetase
MNLRPFIAFLQEAQLTPQCRVRIAPTPSGWLHVGNALNFILNALLAKCHTNGQVLLRIDDLDTARKRPEYLQDIFQTLEWLGLEWQEGPSGPEELERDWSQQRRLPLYKKTLEQLREKQLVYPCARSRSDLAAGIEADITPDLDLDLDRPMINWRALTPPGLALQHFVVRQRNGFPSYQVASLTDDVHFRISHLVRGADLLPSTEAQRWMATELGYLDFVRVPCYHHPLITLPSGEKLSKSAGATALKTQREEGHSPAFIFRQIANWMGIESQNVKSLSELAASLPIR